MLVTISPAKKLDWDPTDIPMSDPELTAHTQKLASAAKKLSSGQLQKLMKLSKSLADLNHARFAEFSNDPPKDALRAAIFAFAGDTYQGLEAKTLNGEDVDYAQEHLRILSGLYGVLRPLDGIQAYRLEMGSRLKLPKSANLYEFWGDVIGKTLRAHADANGSTAIVNCASNEYFKAVDLKALDLPVITPKFLEVKGGKSSMIGFYAKRARGAMARYIVETRLKNPDDLRGFSSGGYRYDPDASTPSQPVFSREAP